MSDHGKVLVIDDEPQIRHFLRISLSSQGFEVAEASTGQQGLALLNAQPTAFALVLLDLGLPDMDGQQVLATLRKRSAIPVIVVSVRGHEAEKVHALDNGANDYVTKPFGIQELLARIRALLRRQVPQRHPQRYQQAGLILDTAAYQITLNGRDIHLTPKEFAVLAQLMANAGRIVTQTQLLRDIWGPSHREDTHYLRIVVSKLRQKLSDDSQFPTLIQTEPGIGYRLYIEPGHEDTTL
ncbi:MAG: response regulator transcription factor [Halomonadaceae bacterium]|uniref:Response regulator transcription factor n=1 Tax=Halomonas colorata TaxID=2742615 RepID=A0ABR9G192_9GAMM|nr:response regulator transcription factor [Halomonas colorata]MBE0464630.1 response regulator transcription factor [Halomonas colorata]